MRHIGYGLLSALLAIPCGAWIYLCFCALAFMTMLIGGLVAGIFGCFEEYAHVIDVLGAYWPVKKIMTGCSVIGFFGTFLQLTEKHDKKEGKV
jgi:hypothetical protein